MSFAAAWIFAGFALRRHAHYESTAYDLGFFDQIVWNTSRGRWFETSFVDYNFLGQHFEPVLLAFAGLYRLGAGPESLLAIQAGMVSAAAIPLFYATRRLTASPIAALALALTFLLNPALHRALDFDLHPELLGFFFVFSALYFLVAGRTVASLLAVAPILLLKEDLAVLAAAFGVLAWMRGHRREGAALVSASIVWAMATVLVVMPMLRAGGSDLNHRFDYLVEDTTLVTLLPLATWRGLSQLVGETLPAAAALVLTTGGLPLLSPAVLLAVPSAALNGLARHSQQSSLDLQYTMAPLSLLFVSMTVALGDLATGKGILRRLLPKANLRLAAPVLGTIALAATAAAFFTSSPYGPGEARYATGAAHRRAIAEALAQIPPDANLSAQNTLVPHLSRRQHIYEFPDVREKTGYVVVDASLPITLQSRDAGYDSVLDRLPGWGFRLVSERDGVRVFARELPR